VTEGYTDLSIPAGPSLGLAWGLGLLTALASIGAAVAVLAIQWQHQAAPLLISAATLGLGFLVARLILGFVVSEQRSVVAALTMVGLAPLLGSAAVHQMSSDAAIGSSLSTVRIAGVVALAISCFLVVGVLVASLARRLGRRFGPLLRVGAIAAVVAGMALVGHTVAAGLGIYSATGPFPRSVAAMPPGEVAGGRFFEEVPLRNEERNEDGNLFALGRCCIGDRCFAYVRHGSEVRVIGPRFPQHASIELLHSDWRNELTLLSDGHLLAVAPDDLSGGEWTEPTAATAARMHLPESLGALALVGLGGAMLLMAGGFRLRRKLACVAAARVGQARGNGWLEVEGDSAPRRSLCDLEPGPVLLLGSGAHDTHAYRGDCRDQEVDVLAGSRQSVTASLVDRIATVDALVVGWLVPLCAPAAAGAALVFLG